MSDGRQGADGTTSAAIDLEHFEVLTFDCYGTLIDWEAGLTAGLKPLVVADGTRPAEAFLEAFARHEADLEAGPYRPYREILAEAARRVADEFGARPSDEAVATFADSVGDWPAFPDSTAALRRLGSRYRLGVITNCDDDLFEASRRRLDIDFDWVVTAEQVGSYKPDPRNFEAAFERIGRPRDRILHVAQSLFHDHRPAKALGLTTAWIDRRAGREGFGATPPAEATPDLILPDLASLAELAGV